MIKHYSVMAHPRCAAGGCKIGARVERQPRVTLSVEILRAERSVHRRRCGEDARRRRPGVSVGQARWGRINSSRWLRRLVGYVS